MRNSNLIICILVILLSGARNVNNSDLAQQVYNRMKKLFPQMTNPLTSAAVLLSNVYASSGEMDKAADIRRELYRSGAKKKVGLSWTEANGQVFVSLLVSSSSTVDIKLDDIIVGISSTRSISSSIQWNLYWTWENIQRTDSTWSSIRSKLDYPTFESGWNDRVSSMWSQWTTSHSMELCWRSQCKTNSYNQKSSCLWRLSYVIIWVFLWMHSSFSCSLHRSRNEINRCHSSMWNYRAWCQSCASLLHKWTMLMQRLFLTNTSDFVCFLSFSFSQNKTKEKNNDVFV